MSRRLRILALQWIKSGELPVDVQMRNLRLCDLAVGLGGLAIATLGASCTSIELINHALVQDNIIWARNAPPIAADATLVLVEVDGQAIAREPIPPLTPQSSAGLD